jgi:hypothetical protein
MIVPIHQQEDMGVKREECQMVGGGMVLHLVAIQQYLMGIGTEMAHLLQCHHMEDRASHLTLGVVKCPHLAVRWMTTGVEVEPHRLDNMVTTQGDLVGHPIFLMMELGLCINLDLGLALVHMAQVILVQVALVDLVTCIPMALCCDLVFQ